ncbi:MAG: hypothetical protein K8S55_14600 [Phycisphaerae bacterium]|nr:hypothetical protein [Phycisphaerae bacterium]
MNTRRIISIAAAVVVLTMVSLNTADAGRRHRPSRRVADRNRDGRVDRRERRSIKRKVRRNSRSHHHGYTSSRSYYNRHHGNHYRTYHHNSYSQRVVYVIIQPSYNGTYSVSRVYVSSYR